MKRGYKFLFTAFIILSSLAIASEKKSITRTEDPVVMKGAELKEMLGALPEVLCLMTFENGVFKPIPFQID